MGHEPAGLRVTAQINNGYRTPNEVRALLAELTGQPVDDSVVVVLPFHSEFGKNLTRSAGSCRCASVGG